MPTQRGRRKPAVVLNNENFAQLLIKMRTERGLSQSDLAYSMAKPSGKSVMATMQLLKSWEGGHSKPSYTNLLRLFEALECTVAVFENP